jgi:hypothetical protein
MKKIEREDRVQLRLAISPSLKAPAAALSPRFGNLSLLLPFLVPVP